MSEKKHNPILNGSTKKMILIVTIMIGIIALTSLFCLVFALTEENVDGDGGTIHIWVIKTIFGGITSMGLGALARMTTKFMDTRTAQERDRYKLEKYKIKMNHKNEKMKWKLKQEEIMKGK